MQSLSPPIARHRLAESTYPMKHQPHQLLTVSEAAELKGVSRAALYGAISRNRLPHTRVLGHIALRKSDVLAWIAAGNKGGRPKGVPMSEQHRASLSQAQKQRWQQRKKAS